MSEVKRYDMIDKPFHFGANMERAEDGEWVDYEDYDAERQARVKAEKEKSLIDTVGKQWEHKATVSLELTIKQNKRMQELMELLNAVKVSEFSGIKCEDVNGQNWFDRRFGLGGDK